MKLLWVVISSICLLFIGSSSALSQISVVTGSCVIINQSIELGESSALNQELNCETPDPNNAFRVRYVWLDANSTSFLLGDVLSKDLKKLLGEDPVIVRNSVHKELTNIWDQFATKVIFDGGYAFTSRGSHFSQTVAHKKGLSKSETFKLSDISGEDLEKIKFYDATDHVVWPYVDQIEATFNTNQITPGMKMTYGFGNDGQRNRDHLKFMRSSREDDEQYPITVYDCTLSYDFLQMEEYENYWQDADILKKRLENSGEFQKYISFIEPTLDYTTNSPVSNSTFESFAHYTEVNWPDDFLLRYYQHQSVGCGIEPNLRVIPRQLFVKLAVIQSKSGKFDLRGYRYKENEFTGLRKVESENYGGSNSFITGELGRKKGQSLIVPIAIELRYPLDEYPFGVVSNNKAAKRFYKEIQNSPFSKFSYPSALYAQEGPLLVKNKSAFRAPLHTELTRTYLFGPQLSIEAINVGGTEIEIRPAPAMASLLNGGFEEGSCPFLYYQLSNGEIVKHGRILIGAHSSDKEMTEYVTIPENAVKLIIREEEPEISFIRNISLLDDNNQENDSLIENVRLNPQKEIQISLPLDHKVGVKERRIAITGFYRQLK